MVAQPRKRRTAEELAANQREISVSEFFTKNSHLLGFDSPLRALMTTVKEGVDNALDACEEAGVLPDVTVTITRVKDVDEIEAKKQVAVCGFTGVELEHGVPSSARSDADPHAEDPSDDESTNADGLLPSAAPEEPVETAAAARRASAAAGSVFRQTLFDHSEDEDEDGTAGETDSGSENSGNESSGNESSDRAVTATKTKKSRKTKGRSATAEAESYLVVIEDNGPGIVVAQIGKIFGKLLYGSKFHRLRQSRGQQGIGISAAGMYGQMTTGKPVRIFSRTGPRKAAHYVEVSIDTARNQPQILVSEPREWNHGRGTRVEIELKAKYQRGQRSVDKYLRATALANPHITLRYRDPHGDWVVYERAVQKLPPEPREVKPHPEGVELGIFQQMLQTTQEQKLGGFLTNAFCRVSQKGAAEICSHTSVTPKSWIKGVSSAQAQELHEAIAKVKFINPPTDCISPIGEGLLIDSLSREYPEAFLKAVTRSPAVYRGNPFQVEVALAHGKGIPADGAATVLRFANRVPLLYQQGACVITKAVNEIRWSNYKVQQPRGGSPQGPLLLIVHLASVWVPFTSESKEAVASYDEIKDEIKRAVMDCGRTLGRHISAVNRERDALKKRDYIARYIPKIAEALQGILEFDAAELESTTETLKTVLDRSRKL